MTGDAAVWLVLAGSALVTFTYRVLPALVPQLRYASTDTAWLRFFDYASYAVIGGIVGSNLLSAAGLSPTVDLLAADLLATPFVPGLCGVAASFAIAVITQRQAVAIVAGLVVFQAAYWLWP